MVIKSQKARDYLYAFSLQCPQLEPPMTGDLRVTMTIFYASRRPDLDESVILDAMQSRKVFEKVPGKKRKQGRVVRNNIYENDRQVREKHIYWALDPANPRAEITVEQI